MVCDFSSILLEKWSAYTCGGVTLLMLVMLFVSILYGVAKDTPRRALLIGFAFMLADTSWLLWILLNNRRY